MHAWSGTSDLDLQETKIISYGKPNTLLYYVMHTATDGTVTTTAVPEFPFGAALEITLVGVIAYIWWRSKRKQPPKLLSKTNIPLN